ncbi:MAG: hypothetical protein JW837_05130 [Sedimentisphaerales bacterium]|nr:hypothetical protein [Sedimentisphaerales bacterium]
MRFSIVIPQMFYDLIARILPGFFFLAFVMLNLPGLGVYLCRPLISEGGNFVDSLGFVFGYAAICYFLGWFFHSITYSSKREIVRQRHTREGEKTPGEKYQRIRIAHPDAGFRVAKLRAEARMVETTRTAMAAIIILTIVYLCIMLFRGFNPRYQMMAIIWIRSFVGLFLAGIVYYSFRRCEDEVWGNYYGNIEQIYKILEAYVDPVRLFP